jgi:hypothetical protein
LQYNIRLSADQVADLLLSAAKSGHFASTYCAVQVAKFLGAKAREYAQSGARCPISLRTLEMGVEIAENEPESWQELLESAIPGVAPALLKGVAVKSSVDVLKILGQSGMKVSQQFTEFHQVTGMSRRSFFYQRKKLGLSHKRQESDYDGLSAEQ